MFPRRSLYIGQVVAISFGLVLFLALLIGIAGRVAFEISNNQNEVIETRNRISGLSLRLELLTIERSDTVRRFIDTGDERLRLRYQSQQSDYITIYNELAATLRSQEEAELFRELFDANATFDATATRIFEEHDTAGRDGIQQIWEEDGIPAQRDLFGITDEWGSLLLSNGEQVINEARQTEQLAVRAVTLFSVLVFLGGVIASIVLIRIITRPISQLVQQTKQIDFDETAEIQTGGPREIAFLGESLNHMAHRLIRAKEAVQLHKDRLERELIAASETQAGLLPPSSPPPSIAIDVACYWQPARELAGDFYTYAPLNNGNVGFVLGDVVGKGAAAAMAGALTLGLVEASLAEYDHPSAMLQHLNNTLCTRFVIDYMAASCIYAVLDQATLQLNVANGGCIHPYIRRQNELLVVHAWGFPLGLTKQYEYQTKPFQLQAGDIVILSSDGLVEAQNDVGELLGFDRFEEILKTFPANRTAEEITDLLITRMQDFIGSTELSDDVTLMVIRL